MPNRPHKPAGSPAGSGGQFDRTGRKPVVVQHTQSQTDDEMFDMFLRVDQVGLVDSEPAWINGQMSAYLCSSEEGRKLFVEYPTGYAVPELVTENEFGIHEFVITLSDDKVANGERRPGEPFLAEVKTEYVYHTTFGAKVSKLVSVQYAPVIGGFKSSASNIRVDLDTLDYPYYEPFDLVIDRVVANIQNDMW